MSDSGGSSASAWLPVVIATAVGAVLAGASSYLVHLYVASKLQQQARDIRRSMKKELHWQLSRHHRDEADSEDEGQAGEQDHARPHHDHSHSHSHSHNHSHPRHRAGKGSGTPPAAHAAPAAAAPAAGRGPAGDAPKVPAGLPKVQHLKASWDSAGRSFSPDNRPKFLSPAGSHSDLPTLTITGNFSLPGAHQGKPGGVSPTLQTCVLQEQAIPVRGMSVHSVLTQEAGDDEEDILVNEENENELEEEQHLEEAALVEKQRQLSETRMSPAGPVPMPLAPGAAVVAVSADGTLRDGGGPHDPRGAIGGRSDSQAGAAEDPAGHGKQPIPALHSFSKMQDNVLHPVSDPMAADILRHEPEHEEFVRVNVAPMGEPSPEDREVLRLLQQCLALRDKYVFRAQVPEWRQDRSKLPIPDPQDPFKYSPEPASQHAFKMVDGVVRVYENSQSMEEGKELFPVWDATTFFTDMHHVLRITSLGPVRTLSFYRLKLLEQSFQLHLLLNADRESYAQKSAPHRDFYNVRKVDTHVHHSACMNQKHLLRFIKSKLRKEPDEVVIFRDGTFLTLKEVFESLDLNSYNLNVDLLDVHADKNTLHRFDKFNLKYNPCGQSRLREIFIKQENLIQGRFLADLTKEVMEDLIASKYQMAEYRISVYGRKKSEWDQLANWAVNNNLACPNVVWLIQLPRLYQVYKDMGIMANFQAMLDNIFLPLFEVTVDPSTHPHLHVFLKHVVGFDMVDDESKPERRPTKHMPKPVDWTNQFNPAYAYYTYYCYANLFVLNKLRESKNMSIIRFRPHCGEAGDIDHLAAAFLTAHNIAHGNNLRRAPALQYLYYLKQIGLAMSPLSNNSLFIDYHKNPFPTFFARGLNISLSTDDPLMIHLTKEALVEEYSIAAQVWRLSSCDLCEIARNSVYQSGFSHPTKEHWVGPVYFKRGPMGNDIHNTNVPQIRMTFRHEVWTTELQYVYLGGIDIPDEIDQ